MTARRLFWPLVLATALVLPWLALSTVTEGQQPPKEVSTTEAQQNELLRELKTLRDQLDRVIQAADRATQPPQPTPAPAKPAEVKPAAVVKPIPRDDEVTAITIEKIRSSGGGYAWNMSVGWEFETTDRVKVTALGIWDSDGKGLDVAVPVGIWNSAGKLLASTHLPSGTDARLIDQFRYASIDPIELPSGQRFVIAVLYTPQVKENNISFGSANVSMAAPLKWIRSRRTKSENLIMPTVTEPKVPNEEPFGSFGPGFLLAGDDISKGVRNYYRMRNVPETAKSQLIVVPEQLDGSHREDKVITISLFALPNGQLTQVMFDATPLGVGTIAFANLANEMQRVKALRTVDRPSVRLAAMSSVRASDLQLALNAMERGEVGRRDSFNVVKTGEVSLFPAARVKQPSRNGQFVVEDRFHDAGDYIEDRWTGLLWQKDGTTAGKKNFYEARDYAAGLKLGGITGWRVPKIEECTTIFPANFEPFANAKYNPDRCCGGPEEFASIWTSELDLPTKDYAYVFQWYATGGANNCFASKNYVYVRCVHDPLPAR